MTGSAVINERNDRTGHIRLGKAAAARRGFSAVETLAALAPSAVAARRLPGARLTATRGPSPLGDRVVLHLAWDATGRREHPLALAVWLPAAPGGER